MSRDREQSFTIEGKDQGELLQFLEAFASKHKTGPVWVLPLRLADGGLLCEISQDPGYWHKGALRFIVMPGREAFEVLAQRGTFADPGLFWGTVDELKGAISVLESGVERGPHPTVQQRREAVKKLYLEALTDAEIAYRVGYSVSTVKRDRREMGLVRKKEGET
jgi:hypothetical protein